MKQRQKLSPCQRPWISIGGSSLRLSLMQGVLVEIHTEDLPFTTKLPSDPVLNQSCVFK